MTKYLTVDRIIEIHQEMISRYGGSDGVRDKGALEAAAGRPQTGHYADVIAEAAALMESLAINHPFIDGNKRVAFGAADVFLRINGYAIDGDSMDIYKKMIELFESSNFKIDAVEAMIRNYVRPENYGGKQMDEQDKKEALEKANREKREEIKVIILLFLYAKGEKRIEEREKFPTVEEIANELGTHKGIIEVCVKELLDEEFIRDYLIMGGGSLFYLAEKGTCFLLDEGHITMEATKPLSILKDPRIKN